MANDIKSIRAYLGANGVHSRSFKTDKAVLWRASQVFGVRYIADDPAAVRESIRALGRAGRRARAAAFLAPRPQAGSRMTLEEIERYRTPRGGYTAATLRQWGVPWPPPRGWKEALIRGEPIPQTT